MGKQELCIIVKKYLCRTKNIESSNCNVKISQLGIFAKSAPTHSLFPLFPATTACFFSQLRVSTTIELPRNPPGEISPLPSSLFLHRNQTINLRLHSAIKQGGGGSGDGRARINIPCFFVV